jgi:cytochrome bd-type quinol oxidase subunit 1
MTIEAVTFVLGGTLGILMMFVFGWLFSLVGVTGWALIKKRPLLPTLKKFLRDF